MLRAIPEHLHETATVHKDVSVLISSFLSGSDTVASPMLSTADLVGNF